MSDRVMLTGPGAISSIGLGAMEFAAGMHAVRSGAKPITAFGTVGLAHTNGCEITDLEPKEWVRRLAVGELGSATQFSVAASRTAVANAG